MIARTIILAAVFLIGLCNYVLSAEDHKNYYVLNKVYDLVDVYFDSGAFTLGRKIVDGLGQKAAF